MDYRFHTLQADGITVTLDLAAGHLRSLAMERNNRIIEPLHTAPWVDDPAIQGDPEIPNVLKYLSGDFLCAPFGASDVEDGPPHGWPANSPWRFEGAANDGGAKNARFVLERRVQEARLIKEFTVRDGHPFLYISHHFEGGSGAISVSSHAMTRFEHRGRLAFSAKAFAELPDEQQEPDPAKGRSVFAKSKRFNDLSKLPLAAGSKLPLAAGWLADLHDYPIADRHEDFVMLVETQESALGWTAALRLDQGDIMLSLKNPADFPVTFLWFSNEGRDYVPWNSRHRGVLGIEEGRAYSIYGHAASIRPNPLSDAGIPTSLALDPEGPVSVHHVLGGLPMPEGWDDVASVVVSKGNLRLTSPIGETFNLPFDDSFLTTDG